MRSLFLKVFLWFWLAMALVIIAFTLATELTRSDETFSPHSPMDQAMTVVAKTIVATYERDGQPGLVGYLELIWRETGIRIRLYDEQGTELSGLGAQPEARELVPRAAQSADIVFDQSGERRFIARRVLTGGGRRYVVIDEPPRHRKPSFVNLQAQALRILAALLTAGALCYGLARYLIAPIVKLRDATARFAAGDLGARVGSQMGRRRDELVSLSHDFDRMAERIEALIVAQRRLLGDISHELRSPLARLKVALHLARGHAGSEASAALDRIGREADRINLLIEQLLTLTRLESGAEAGETKLIDLQSLVEEIAADADFEAQSRNRAVRVVASESCETNGSEESLRTAIENVVRNAVHYTAEETEVEITLYCDGDGGKSKAIINVRDHGPGVPDDELDRLFEPFYRTAEARDRESGGVGLGLAIARHAVRLHGGSVAARNAPDGGLDVEIRLPITSNPERYHP